MIDENAYGLWLSYYDIENDEYALEREAFVERLSEFSSLLRDCVRSFPLGTDLHAVDLGHAVYVEMADGSEEEDPIVWLKMTRARMTGRTFQTAAILTYGGRWTDEEDGIVELDPFDKGGLVRIGHASEPLRKALYADAASRRDDELDGWGPGLYVDTEAVEAMGRALKNAPTPLNASGATFYRMGK